MISAAFKMIQVISAALKYNLAWHHNESSDRMCLKIFWA